MKMLIMFYASIAIVLMSAGQLAAKYLYVAPDGSDDVSYLDNSIVAPWASPAKAWSLAQAGDIVYFRQGTYNITTQIVTKFIGNNGTEEQPIVFTSYPEERAVFSASGLTGVNGYVFGIQRNYNHVSNISFIGSAATWFYLGEDNPAEHFEVRNCSVKLGSGGDNTGFVKTTKRSNYLVVENCIIEGPGQDVHQNTSCLYTGSADYLTVKNNTLYNAPIGIYFKTDNAGDTGNVISYNYIYNTSRNSIQTNSQFTSFNNNIIGSGCGSFQINEGNGFALGDNNIVTHNIIMSGGLVLNTDNGGAINNTIINNIVSSYTNCCSGNIWDYNMYMSGVKVGENDIENTSPVFKVTDPVLPQDFDLISTSAGYLKGSDGENIGVVSARLVGAKPSKVKDFRPAVP